MKRAIITGIRRIGHKVAKSLLEKGWTVGVVYKTSEDIYKSLSKEFGPRVFGVRADLSLWQDCERAIRELSERLVIKIWAKPV